MVYSKASKIMAGFDEGTVIKSQTSWWLAVPTPNAPKRGMGGKRINPSNFPEHRFGKLRFVYRRGGSSLLVVENVQASYSRKTGELRGFRKASKRNLKTGNKLSSAVMFWLVPQVKLPKLIRFDEEAKRWYDKLPRLILKNWPED